jgi:lysophospholipase L1-like esterase
MKFAYKILIPIISIMIFLGMSELILFLAGFDYYPVDFGYNLTEEYKVFMEDPSDSEYLVTLPDAVPYILGQKFKKIKPENTYRIFILGGSCVYNLYESHIEGTKSNNLKNLFEGAYPQKDFEIINGGAPSYGSTRTLVIFQEILDYDPDLIILYSSHNEFGERYYREKFQEENILTFMRDCLEILRTYRLLYLIISNLKKGSFLIYASGVHNETIPFPEKTYTGWNFYDLNEMSDTEKDEVYRQYEKNIETMIRVGKNNNIPIVISTLSSNYLSPPDWVPSNYTDYGHVAEMSIETVKNLIDSGVKDPFLEFRIGEYYFNQNLPSEAKYHLDNAFSDDLHRANENINRIIRDLSLKFDVPLADVENEIVKKSRNGIPNYEFFEDAWHFNKMGQEIFINTLFKTVREKIEI